MLSVSQIHKNTNRLFKLCTVLWLSKYIQKLLQPTKRTTTNSKEQTKTVTLRFAKIYARKR
jgi:hypothetical protein